MPLTVVNGPTIAAGQSLSDKLNVSAGDLCRLTIPAAWDNAPITFQASTDDVGYNDLYDINGNELTMAVKPGAGILLNSNIVQGIAWLKIRSGTSKGPVNQSAQRTFAVSLKTP